MVNIDKEHLAILVVDMLNDFLKPRGAIYCKECTEIIPNIKKLVDRAREEGIPIIYVCDSHPNTTDPEVKKWGPHTMRGTWGAQVIEELQPTEKDYIVTKRTYDGFYNTELEITLRSLNVKSVVVVGIHTHVCVLMTSLGAFYRGFEVIALEDCMTTSYKPNHESRLRFYKTHVGELMKLDEFLSLLK